MGETNHEPHEDDQELVTFDDLKSDLMRAMRRTRDARYLEAKGALTDDVYPLFMNFVEQVDQRMTRLEGVVADLADQNNSAIEEDLANQIFDCFNIGLAMVAAVEKLGDPVLNQLADGFKRAVAIVGPQIKEAMVPEDDDDEDDDEDDQDDEEDDEDEAADAELVEDPEPMQVVAAPEEEPKP